MALSDEPAATTREVGFAGLHKVEGAAVLAGHNDEAFCEPFPIL